MIELTIFRIDEQITIKVLESGKPFRVAVQEQNGLITVYPSRYSPLFPTGTEHWYSVKEKGNIRLMLAKGVQG